ncbi:28S ribosomal protein S28, mitochondrial [Ischnura elegans]|uniref:28S ribosomal protein S28, mitochondrial n=1 Tax=Ischnura elegans TaxID=197161 RepID=UPI001ED8A5E1|nr:28S ribosomal protein S28, mitochondrial [Ischnura elegans]XP_046383822.1 28S ribosomal protein S28, mitochondrial [Ischnura elegans]
MALALRCAWRKTSINVNKKCCSAFLPSKRFSIDTSKDDGGGNASEQNSASQDTEVSGVRNVPAGRGGFARAFEKYTAKETPPPEVEESFASLLRKSKFIDLGDPEGRLVEGTIYHVVDDDLYIDFGWKFPCVCSRPARNGRFFVRGAKVLLRLKDLELSTRFLGADRDLTLLEADATLTALLYSPVRDSKKM